MTINSALEARKFYTTAALYINRSFDELWHLGVLHKVKTVQAIKNSIPNTDEIRFIKNICSYVVQDCPVMNLLLC